MKQGPYCALCIRYLPRPATWTDGDLPDNPPTREVRGWEEAVAAYDLGYRFTTRDLLVFGIYAVTYVAGTAACYGHAYFLANEL
jgi:hypothetical protein